VVYSDVNDELKNSRTFLECPHELKRRRIQHVTTVSIKNRLDIKTNDKTASEKMLDYITEYLFCLTHRPVFENAAPAKRVHSLQLKGACIKTRAAYAAPEDHREIQSWSLPQLGSG
jgi:hypothetical protein